MQEHVPEVRKKHGFSFSPGLIDKQMVALSIINLLAIFFVYLPFLNDLSIIARYWDGPMYMYVAKTLYVVPQVTPFAVPSYYFACHLALFPLLIRAFSFMGYDVSMIFVVALSSTLATLVFYLLLKDFNYSVNPFWASIVFIFFPSRWLLYHSVGASEPLFILLVLASIYSYKKEWYITAFTLAGLASITRIFGVLMFVSYAILLAWQKKYRYIPYTLIIPAFIGLNFLVYLFTYGDPFAYFHYNGSYMSNTPFQPFLAAAEKGVTNNAELFFAFYIIYIVGTLRLWKHPELFTYSLIFLGFTLFVYHPDISRYLLPVAPSALIVAFDDIISSKEFMVVFPLVILFGYFYCWGIIPTNLAQPELYAELIRIMGG